MKTNNRGITLVAVIITLIMLLIITSVTVNIASDFIWSHMDKAIKDTNAQIKDERVQEETIQNNWEEQPGKVTKSETLGINAENNKPTLKVTATNITATTVTIVATGVDIDEDNLKYTLIINNKTFGPSENNTWDIKELTPGTTYNYTVKVTDGYDTVLIKGSIETASK